MLLLLLLWMMLLKNKTANKQECYEDSANGYSAVGALSRHHLLLLKFILRCL